MATTKKKPKTLSHGVQLRLKNLSDAIARAQKTVTTVKLPEYKAGDTVRVHVKIKEGEKERVQAFEGLVIAKGNHPGGKSFTVRKMSHGVGVERIFLESSPRIAKLEVMQEGRVRRAKLYYIRELEGKAAKIKRDREGEAQTAALAAASAAPSVGKKA